MLIRSVDIFCHVRAAVLASLFPLLLLQGCSLNAAKPATVDATPQEQPLTPELTAAYNEGLTLLRNHHYDAAGIHWQNLSQQYPQYPGVWTNLAVCQYQQQQFTSALESLNKAHELAADYCPVFKLRGLLQRELGQFTAAEQSYRQAITCDPADADVHYNLGILYDLYLHDLAQALEQYTQAQSMAAEPDETLSMWITDLQRRSAGQVAGEGS